MSGFPFVIVAYTEKAKIGCSSQKSHKIVSVAPNPGNELPRHEKRQLPQPHDSRTQSRQRRMAIERRRRRLAYMKMNPARIARPTFLLVSVVLAFQSVEFLVRQGDQSTFLRVLEQNSLSDTVKERDAHSGPLTSAVEETTSHDERIADGTSTGEAPNLRMVGFTVVDTKSSPPPLRRREVFIVPDKRAKLRPVRLEDFTSPSARSGDMDAAKETATVPGQLHSSGQTQKQEKANLSKVSKSKRGLFQRKSESAFEKATRPDPRLPTIALEKKLQLGFRNECTAFTALVMQALDHNISQILLPSVSFKDHGGTGKRIAFENLFNVVHWNSHSHTSLPRLVSYDPKLHPQWNESARRFIVTENDDSDDPVANSYTRPFALLGGELQHLAYHHNYTAQLEQQTAVERNAAELHMLKGALRPHPDIQSHIDGIVKANKRDSEEAEASTEYMVLHARVEPDLQRTRRCVWARVKRLSTILEMLERRFPDPPTRKLLIAMNRHLLEEAANANNKVAEENLITLDHALKNGLWNGTVQVQQAGSSSLKGTSFRHRPGVIGSLVDFFLAANAKVFVGTEVSRFSMDVITTRFYHAQKANYLYLPRGVKHATPEETERPPRFKC